MEEIWKDIEGFEGKYQISNTNKVKSNHFGKSIILKPALNTGGYNSVSLSLNNKAKSVTLHRLIMTAFIANPDNKPCINHIDGNKLNNSLSNLEWCTYKYNNIYNNKSKKNCIAISQYDLEGNFIKDWESARQVYRQLKIQYKNICKCCKGKRKKAGGGT